MSTHFFTLLTLLSAIVEIKTHFTVFYTELFQGVILAIHHRFKFNSKAFQKENPKPIS